MHVHLCTVLLILDSHENQVENKVATKLDSQYLNLRTSTQLKHSRLCLYRFFAFNKTVGKFESTKRLDTYLFMDSRDGLELFMARDLARVGGNFCTVVIIHQGVSFSIRIFMTDTHSTE